MRLLFTRLDQVPGFIQNQFRRRSLEFRSKRKLGRVPIWKHPFKIERYYIQELLYRVDIQHQMVQEIIYPHLPGLASEARQDLPEDARQDAWADETERLLNSLEISLQRSTPDARSLAIDVGQRTNKWNDNQWRRTLKKVLGVDLFLHEPWLGNQLSSFTNENIKLIKSLGENNLTSIEGIMQRGFRNGDRHETIRKQIEAQFDTTRNKAKFIARDQVSKLNGQLTKSRQTNIGVSRYIWHDSDDSRVRISHSQNDDLLMSWSDATIYYPTPTSKPVTRVGVHLHPGEDYQCRCWAEAYFDDVADQFGVRPRARTEDEAIARRERLTPTI